MKPNLFIVGAPRCGTTAWFHYLRAHPDIYFSPFKEPHYFCTDFPNWRWFKSESEYLALFDESGKAKVIGEASVRYLHSRDAAKKISRFNPDAKIIIFVRDQHEYLPSQHNQMVFNKDECLLDFEEAWRLSGKRHSSNISQFCREPQFLDYAAAGAFSEHVERYFGSFPEDQIRVFHFRDWSTDPRAAYVDILHFLGVRDDGRTAFPKVNEARQRRTRWLWRLQRENPSAIWAVFRTVKRLLGLDTPAVRAFLLQLDTIHPSPSKISESLKEEIIDYYREDNRRLERRIWRQQLPV